MNEIIPGKLYLGDIMDALKTDLGQHIDRAIALCPEYECHHHCPDSWNAGFFDGVSSPPETIHRAVKLIHEGIETGKRVLIHCAGGVSRSPMVTACYLVKSGRFTNFDAAIEFVHSCRNKVDPDAKTYASGKRYCLSPLRLEPVNKSDHPSGIILAK